ncbi:MAG: hypothetical protein R2712_16445 [Vicinamibacterales bacterium]
MDGMHQILGGKRLGGAPCTVGRHGAAPRAATFLDVLADDTAPLQAVFLGLLRPPPPTLLRSIGV